MVWYACMHACKCKYINNYFDRVFPSKPRLSKPKGIHMSLRPVLPPPSWPGPAAIVDLGRDQRKMGRAFSCFDHQQISVATAAAEQISTEIKLKSDSDLYFNLIYIYIYKYQILIASPVKDDGLKFKAVTLCLCLNTESPKIGIPPIIQSTILLLKPMVTTGDHQF